MATGRILCRIFYFWAPSPGLEKFLLCSCIVNIKMKNILESDTSDLMCVCVCMSKGLSWSSFVLWSFWLCLWCQVKLLLINLLASLVWLEYLFPYPRGGSRAHTILYQVLSFVIDQLVVHWGKYRKGYELTFWVLNRNPNRNSASFKDRK